MVGSAHLTAFALMEIPAGLDDECVDALLILFVVALRKFPKIYACSHVSIVRFVQSTIRVSSDSHGHSSPLYHLPGELVSISSVPVPSIDLNLWNRSRLSAFVPISLGFTSVLTDDIVRSFRNTKS